jgi:hypothetical protein
MTVFNKNLDVTGFWVLIQCNKDITVLTTCYNLLKFSTNTRT